MPTDADFLHAVTADPDADAPRLAYADWLDESGDAARAEFIRIQCALAALPEAEQEYHPLIKRVDELVAAHRDDWLRSFRDLLAPVAATRGWRRWVGRSPQRTLVGARFRRGFVDHLHVDTAAFLARADRLVRMTPLRSLAVEAVRPGPAEIWDALSTCPHLAGLTELKLRSHRLGPEEMRRFVGSEHLPNLRALGVLNPGFDRAAAEMLVRSSLLSRLSALDVLAAGAADHEPCADVFLSGPACRHLEFLVVGGMPDVDAAFLGRLVRTAPFTRLARLDLPGTLVGDADLDDFLDWLPPTLARLGLNYAGLGDRAAASLARSQRIRQLQRLDLSANRISDVGALALADSPNLVASTRVDLRGNPISDRVKNALRIRMGHHVTV